MNNAEVLIKFKGDATEAEQTTKEVEKSFDSLDDKTSKLRAGFLLATIAADAFTASILSGGIEYNAEIETYLTRLETLTGSAEKANAILDQIKKDALATPFEVSSLTQAESLLLSTGISAEQARGDILALGDAIAASGGGNAELSRMAVNLQQIKNVGRASALDIKQFAYAGVDIYGLLADSMGVTREEASQLDVTYEMLSNALQQASQKGGKYYKAMEKQSKTYKGAMSNLSESIQVLKGEFAKGLFNALKKVIPPLTKLFEWMAKNSKIITAIAVPLLLLINTIAALLILKKVHTAFQAFHALLAANPYVLIVAGIVAIVTALIMLWDNCEEFRDFINAMWKGIKAVIGAVVNFIQDVFNAVVDFFMTAWAVLDQIIITPFRTAFDFLYGLIKGYYEFVFSVFNGIKDVIGTVANFFKSAFTTAIDGVKSAFNTMKKTAKTIIDAVVEIIKKPINVLIDGLNVFISGLNKIKIPKWVPGVGGKGLHFDKIKKLATGTNYVPDDMLAIIHKGEAVVPKKYNPYASSVNTSSFGVAGRTQPVINVYVDAKTDPLGQTVSRIKTFSGGAKNDYNYGVGV